MHFRKLVLLVVLSAASTASGSENIDWLYEDVLIALTHQCSESFPDLKPEIDSAIGSYIKNNAALLSHDYEARVRKTEPNGRTYTREQCIGMSALPPMPMGELFQQAAKDRAESETQRAEYEQDHR